MSDNEETTIVLLPDPELPSYPEFHELKRILKEFYGDREDPILDVWVNPHNEVTMLDVLFGDNVSVIPRDLLTEIREAGYGLYAFGTNRSHFSGITASFVVVDGGDAER